MMADSAKQVTHCLLSAYILSRRMHGFGNQRLLITIGKAGLAAGVMGIVAFVLLPLLERLLGSGGIVREAALVRLSGGVSLAVFLVMTALLRLEELRWLVQLLRQRFAR